MAAAPRTESMPLGQFLQLSETERRVLGVQTVPKKQRAIIWTLPNYPSASSAVNAIRVLDGIVYVHGLQTVVIYQAMRVLCEVALVDGRPRYYVQSVQDPVIRPIPIPDLAESPTEAFRSFAGANFKSSFNGNQAFSLGTGPMQAILRLRYHHELATLNLLQLLPPLELDRVVVHPPRVQHPDLNAALDMAQQPPAVGGNIGGAAIPWPPLAQGGDVQSQQQLLQLPSITGLSYDGILDDLAQGEEDEEDEVFHNILHQMCQDMGMHTRSVQM